MTTLTGNETTSIGRLASAPELDEMPQRIKLPCAPGNYPTFDQLLPSTPEIFDAYPKKARNNSLAVRLGEPVAQLERERA